MTRIARAVLVGVAVVGVVGCWPYPGHDANRTAFNDLETRITPANVSRLTEAWTVTEDVPGSRHEVADPVLSHHGVHAVYGGCLIATYRPSDGSRRWLRVPNPSLCSEGRSAHQYSPAFAMGEQVRFGAWGLMSGPGGDTFLPGGGTFDAATGAPVEPGVSDRILAGVRGGFAVSTRPRFGADGVALHNASIVVEPLEGDGPTVKTDTLGGGLPVLGDHAVFHTGPGTLATAPGDPATGEGVRAFSRTQTTSRCGGMTCPLWATRIDGNGNTPVLSPNQSTVYVTTATGRLYALDAATGAVQWTFTFTDASIWAPPALANGMLYAVTLDGTVSALDAEACRAGACSILWSGSTGTRSSVQPAVAGGVVFTGDDDGFVRAFDAAGCGSRFCPRLWQAAVPSAVTGAPAISNGQVYVGTSDGHLIAYQLGPS